MGLFNEFAGVQLKVGKCLCEHYEIGDKVPLDDGIYIGYEGAVVVKDNILVACFSELKTKWGHKIKPSSLLRDSRYNPIQKVIDRMELKEQGKIKGQPKRVKK